MREILQDCQRISTHYEWVAEIIDIYDDIIDSQYFDTLGELQQWVKTVSPDDFENYKRIDWGLHRCSGSEADGMTDREYAYVKSNTLPDYFDQGSKVPKRFHEQLKKLMD